MNDEAVYRTAPAKPGLLINIDLKDEEIADLSKWSWKKYLKENTNTVAFNYLLKDNDTKDKTKHLKFCELKMSDYLVENRNTKIFKYYIQ